MSETTEEITSPCIGVCAMDETTGYCHGCYRTIEEIRNWWDMPSPEKKAVLETLEARQLEQLSFD